MLDEIWTRVIENFGDRLTGPMNLRLVLQPLVACAFAVRSGLKDAKDGKPPYLWAIATDRAHRLDLMKEGWKSIGMVFLVALALDVAYQFAVLRFVYPGEAAAVASLLAIVPYVITRAVTNRLARRTSEKTKG